MAFSGITLGSPNTMVVGQNTQVSLPNGNMVIPRAGQLGEAVTGNLHGPYYETNYRKALQYAYIAPTTLTSANATATGLIVHNPVGSGVNLVLLSLALRVSVTSATMTGIDLAYNIQTTVPTGTTAATSTGSAFLGATAGQAKAYTAATTASAPIPFLALIHNTAAIATTGTDQTVVDLQGEVIVPPGYAVSLSALGAASAASAVSATLFWEEVPV